MGSLIGSSIGGSAGYFLTDEKKGRKRRVRNALLSAFAGGAIGGLSGGIVNTHLRFRRVADAADRLHAKTQIPVPGKICYVNFPNHRFEGKIPIQHSAVLVLPKLSPGDIEKNSGKVAEGYLLSYRAANASLSDPNDRGYLDIFEANGFSGLDPKGIARRVLEMSGRQWGNKVDIKWTDVPDIGRALDYWDAFNADPNRGNYGIFPGQNNCGTVARDIFEYTRNSRLGHLLDLLIGGRPWINAPSYRTNSVSYTLGE